MIKAEAKRLKKQILKSVDESNLGNDKRHALKISLLISNTLSKETSNIAYDYVESMINDDLQKS